MSHLPERLKPLLKQLLQLKKRGMLSVGVWDFRTGRRRSTWRWKSKCLMDKCLRGLQRHGTGAAPVSGPRVVSHILSGEAVWDRPASPGSCVT